MSDTYFDWLTNIPRLVNIHFSPQELRNYSAHNDDMQQYLTWFPCIDWTIWFWFTRSNYLIDLLLLIYPFLLHHKKKHLVDLKNHLIDLKNHLIDLKNHLVHLKITWKIPRLMLTALARSTLRSLSRSWTDYYKRVDFYTCPSLLHTHIHIL